MSGDESAHCWLCERPLAERIDRHHRVPKSKGGRATVPVHPICHRTIHAHATNAQLARAAGSRETLLEIAAVARFVRWVADKPPDFHAPTRKVRR